MNRQRIPWALSGLAFIGLFGIGFVLASVLASAPYPNPFDTTTGAVTRYFAENAQQVRGMSFSYSLAAIALIVFAAWVAHYVPPANDQLRALSVLAFGGGTLSGAFLLLSALALWLLTRPSTEPDAAVVRALHDLAYIAGGPAHIITFAPFVGASSLASLETKALPSWISWLGIAAGGLSLLSVIALLWELAAYILPAARALTFAWIFLVAVVLAFGSPRRGVA